MTIREHFQRAERREHFVTLAFELVLVAFLALTTDRWLIIILIGIAIAGVVHLALSRTFECPRCHENLRRLRNQNLRGRAFIRKGKGGKFWDEWDACPKCGVSFDEEMGPTAP